MQRRLDLNVIICTYNRSTSLKRTLESIGDSVIPDYLQWELIVVDNNSTDNTREVVERYREQSRFPVIYLREQKQGLSHARNRGIKASSGNVIAFTDDDVIVDPHWIGSLSRGFEQYDVQCIGGKILPIWEAPKPEWLSELFHPNLALLDYGDSAFYIDKPNLWGANLAFKAEVFEKYGLFDINRGRTARKLFGEEESFLLEQLLTRQEKALYLPSAIVHHCIPKERMKKSYFRRWTFDQGELEGMLSDDYNCGGVVNAAGFLFKELSASLLFYLISLSKSEREAHEYKKKAILRLGFTKGRLLKELK